MAQRKPQFQKWFEAVKRELLQTEPKNILARSECCKRIIDECVEKVNIKLSLPTLLPSQRYQSHVVPSDHLSFLINWPGLRVDASPRAPKSKKEYEKKSKNWLNGRRAPNYGKTLFPFFIASAEKYISKVSKLLVQNDQQQQDVYYNIVIYLILAKLCGISVTLHEQAKKAPFFCKNSVERKGKLKSLLQSYAPDHQYIQGFPSCFEEAVGFFEKKSDKYLIQYRSDYLGIDDEAKSDIQIHANMMQKKVKQTPLLLKKECRPSQKQIFGPDSPKTDATDYWKKQVMDLKRQISIEQERRQRVEKERDHLQQIVNTSNKKALYNDGSNGSISSCTSSLSMANGCMYQHQPSQVAQQHLARHAPPRVVPMQRCPSSNMANIDPFHMNHQSVHSCNGFAHSNPNLNYVQPVPVPVAPSSSASFMTTTNNLNDIPTPIPSMSSLSWNHSNPNDMFSMAPQRSFDTFSSNNCNFMSAPSAPAPMCMYESNVNSSAFPAFLNQ